MRYRVKPKDLNKRDRDRRRWVLLALVEAETAYRDGAAEVPFVRPSHLASAWKLHPTTIYRCMERLRKAGNVARSGFGIHGEYTITEKGVRKLRWLNSRAQAEESAQR